MIDLGRLYSGDPAYFRDLVKTHGPSLFFVAKSFGEDLDHAEDLYQEIWTHLYRRRREYRERGSFSSWLHKLARNVCIDDSRSRKSRVRAVERFASSTPPEDLSLTSSDPVESVTKEELHRTLHRALANLPDRQYEAVSLRIIEGFCPQEVADQMGVKQTTVRSLIRDAVSNLRILMQEDGR